MGLFSRKSAAADARPRARPSISGEAQARELRVRARRRLIGALALVLAVVIVAPMLFDTTQEGPQESMIVVPMVVAPAVDDPLTQIPRSESPDGGVIIASDDAAAPPPVQPPPTSAPPPNTTQPQPPQSTASRNPASNGAAQTADTTNTTRAANTPTPSAARTPSAPPRQNARTDDGSVALALLEGRQPPSADSPPPNSFVLQIAAYASQQDAIARRDRLVQSGISDVRVETARINGRNTYRVRVGPFSTREAAQAAQTRIRALGDYEDAYITRQ